LIFEEKLNASKRLIREQFELKDLSFEIGKYAIYNEITYKNNCSKETRDISIYKECILSQLYEEISELDYNSEDSFINESFDCIQSYYDDIMCNLEQVKIDNTCKPYSMYIPTDLNNAKLLLY